MRLLGRDCLSSEPLPAIYCAGPRIGHFERCIGKREYLGTAAAALYFLVVAVVAAVGVEPADSFEALPEL